MSFPELLTFTQYPYPGRMESATTYVPSNPKNSDSRIPGGSETIVDTSTGNEMDPIKFQPLTTAMESRVIAWPVM
jgi:hypothetical protein